MSNIITHFNQENMFGKNEDILNALQEFSEKKLKLNKTLKILKNQLKSLI